MTDETKHAADMVEGYLDGIYAANPVPNSNRSASYRHGFLNGRDDLARKPRASADTLRERAAEAIAKDQTRESCHDR